MTAVPLSILKEIEIKGPPSKVWRFLVEPQHMEKWLPKPIGFKPQVGHRFVLASVCNGEQINVDCEILSLAPPNSIVFTWVDATIDLDSVIKIDLQASTNGTLVKFRQDGWRSKDALYDQHAATWSACLEDLAQSAATP
jgi:uncharacterized protein YndB with AHSA1/START domain